MDRDPVFILNIVLSSSLPNNTNNHENKGDAADPSCNKVAKFCLGLNDNTNIVQFPVFPPKYVLDRLCLLVDSLKPTSTSKGVLAAAQILCDIAARFHVKKSTRPTKFTSHEKLERLFDIPSHPRGIFGDLEVCIHGDDSIKNLMSLL